MPTKYFLSLWMLMLCSLQMDAQQGLNSAGNSTQINHMIFDYSIGEMVLVGTESSSQFIITQGLLQPLTVQSNTSNEHTTELHLHSDAIRVYPNPSDNLVFVEWIASHTSQVIYRLYDATGKVILAHEVDQLLGSNKFSLELQAFATGTYYLMLEGVRLDGQQLSFKIQKTR